MEGGGAYGGQKAGANIDIMLFAQRPLVVLRIVTLVSVDCGGGMGEGGGIIRAKWTFFS